VFLVQGAFLNRGSASFHVATWGELSFERFLGAAIFCPMVCFSTIKAELLFEALFFFCLSYFAIYGFEVGVIYLGRGAFLCSYSASVSSASSTSAGVIRGSVCPVGMIGVIECAGLFDKTIESCRLGLEAQQLVVQGFRKIVSESVHFGFIVHPRV
jgi:hypothetical protein